MAPPSSERYTPLALGSGGGRAAAAAAATAAAGAGCGAVGRFACRAAASAGRAAIGSGAAAGAAAGAGLDLRVDDARFGAENGNGDAAVEAVLGARPARRLDAAPTVAAVCRFPKPGAGAAAVIAPPGAHTLQRRRKQNLRIYGVDGDVVEAGIGVDVFGLLPGLAAIRRLEKTALRIRAEEMAHGRHVNDARIGRVHDDAADGLRVVQPEMIPGFAAVGGAPDAVADRRTLAIVGLAGADVDDVRIDGAMAMAPIDSLGMLSNCDFQWLPPSMDFHSPPVAKPT